MDQNIFILYIVNLCELRNRRVERARNTTAIDHFRILTAGLDLAWNGG